MKVLVISSTVFKLPPTGYSGLEMLAAQQAVGLAQVGHQVTVAAPDGSDCPGCFLIPTGPAGKINEHQAFQRYEQELPKFDVCIDHSWQKFTLLWKMKTGHKLPCLGVCHAPLQTMYQSLPDLERPCFVCISNDQGAHFEALYQRPCRVARNGIDPDFYSPLSVERSRRFLFLARFSTVKGPSIGIEACLAAGRCLDLVGDTSITNEPEYLEYCKQLSLQTSLGYPSTSDFGQSKQIRIYGGVPRSEVPWWLSQAHVFLHPNKHFREPLGLAPLEAMACGTPVICWLRGALKETVVHKETGWHVQSERELVDIIKNCEVTPEMRKGCREWVCDNFTISKMIQRYSDLCEEAVSTGGW